MRAWLHKVIAIWLLIIFLPLLLAAVKIALEELAVPLTILFVLVMLGLAGRVAWRRWQQPW